MEGMMKPDSFVGKTILITGGGTGLGRSMGKYLLQLGANLIISSRKKEVFDNVIPSSNSVMARNLFQLGHVLDREDWRQLATSMVSKISSVILAEPGYASHWGIALAEQMKGLAEVVIVGPLALEKRAALAKHYFPFLLVMGTTTRSNLPLFEGREQSGSETSIYVCFNKTCKLPVESVELAIEQLKTLQ